MLSIQQTNHGRNPINNSMRAEYRARNQHRWIPVRTSELLSKCSSSQSVNSFGVAGAGIGPTLLWLFLQNFLFGSNDTDESVEPTPLSTVLITRFISDLI